MLTPSRVPDPVAVTPRPHRQHATAMGPQAHINAADPAMQLRELRMQQAHLRQQAELELRQQQQIQQHLVDRQRLEQQQQQQQQREQRQQARVQQLLHLNDTELEDLPRAVSQIRQFRKTYGEAEDRAHQTALVTVMNNS